MRFRNFDNLRVFNLVARHMSFSKAADELYLTKGAISHQIKRLEQELGFNVFLRNPGHLALTDKGRQLWHTSQTALKTIEKEIISLREDDSTKITVGTPTYFASRWLSSRLMTFINDHPNTSLRIQPVINMFNLQTDNIDMAIRWGKGDWNDLQSELLFYCPAFLTAGKDISEEIKHCGLENTLQKKRFCMIMKRV
ncbi:MAG: DNA-binding transcriptional LysR family regulator [Cocleimonas sp.]|jgi:DNA-binding transcriptional LysR family regulator